MAPQSREKLVAQRIHLRAVRGHVHVHTPAEDVAPLEAGHQLVHALPARPTRPSNAGCCSPRWRAPDRGRPVRDACRRATARPAPWRPARWFDASAGCVGRSPSPRRRGQRARRMPRPPRPCCDRRRRPAPRPTTARARPATPAWRTAPAARRRSATVVKPPGRPEAPGSPTTPRRRRSRGRSAPWPPGSRARRARSSRPIPSHCAPWPGNTKTTRWPRSAAQRPTLTLAAGRPSPRDSSEVGQFFATGGDDEPLVEVCAPDRRGSGDVGERDRRSVPARRPRT